MANIDPESQRIKSFLIPKIKRRKIEQGSKKIPQFKRLGNLGFI